MTAYSIVYIPALLHVKYESLERWDAKMIDCIL